MNQPQCYVYARKSSETEDRQALSIESQLTEIRNLAKRHEFSILKELVEAKSAKEPGRPVFNELIEAIKAGRADTILCWKLDRLARNPIDQGTLQYLLQKGVIKRIITSDRDYLPEDNVLLMNVELGMANQYVLDLRKNVMRGNKTKLEKGWLPGKPPIGYLNEPVSRTIVPDPERFPLIQRLLRMFLTETYSPLDLLKIARDEFRLTLPKKSQGVGKDLGRSYIYDLLRDPFYCGIIVRKGERYTGAHERMITIVEHEQILQLLSKVTKSESSVKTETKPLFPLGGLIRCSCGRMITAYCVKKQNGKVYRYYKCARKARLDGPSCREPDIKAEFLEEQAGTVIQKLTLPAPLAEWMKTWAKYGNFQESFIQQLELENLNKERERSTKRLSSLLNLLIDGTITKDDYETERKKTNNDLEQIKVRIEANEVRLREWEQVVCDVLDLAVVAKRLYEKPNSEDKKLVLRGIGSNFVLSNKKLSIEVKKPFQIIMDRQIVLTLQDELDLTRETQELQRKNAKSHSLQSGIPLWWTSRVIYRTV
jgi:DNA invertase Pin-like site-specific DNA recombinase